MNSIGFPIYAGGSGSGKTTLTNTLVDRCNGRALPVSHDRYYRYMLCGNYDLPETFETDLMIAYLNRLRSGHSVGVPVLAFWNLAFA